MPRAQKPAEDECKGVVNDDPLNLLGEALVTHLASPASDLRHRYSQHDLEGDRVEPGGTLSNWSTIRHPFQRASRCLREPDLELLERWTMRHPSSPAR